jgi:hypothetical protein
LEADFLPPITILGDFLAKTRFLGATLGDFLFRDLERRRRGGAIFGIGCEKRKKKNRYFFITYYFDIFSQKKKRKK